MTTDEPQIDLTDEHGVALLATIGEHREPVLYRWITPDRGEADTSDEPIEYAVSSLPDEPWLAGYGGVMLWGRYSYGWVANPGGRSLVAHLLTAARERDALFAEIAKAECGFTDESPLEQVAWLARERSLALVARDAANERVAALEAIVAKLPVTADGVPIVHPMSVWQNAYDGVHELKVTGIESGGIVTFTDARWPGCPFGMTSATLYSTREAAALAASVPPIPDDSAVPPAEAGRTAPT